jgi:TolA-binding protein
MTFDQASQKVSSVLEGVGGRYAIICLLSIIAGTSTWMLKTEIEQATQQSILVERMTNLQTQAVIRDTQISSDLAGLHRSIDQVNASIGSLEVRFGQMSQQLQDSKGR